MSTAVNASVALALILAVTTLHGCSSGPDHSGDQRSAASQSPSNGTPQPARAVLSRLPFVNYEGLAEAEARVGFDPIEFGLYVPSSGTTSLQQDIPLSVHGLDSSTALIIASSFPQGDLVLHEWRFLEGALRQTIPVADAEEFYFRFAMLRGGQLLVVLYDVSDHVNVAFVIQQTNESWHVRRLGAVSFDGLYDNASRILGRNLGASHSVICAESRCFGISETEVAPYPVIDAHSRIIELVQHRDGVFGLYQSGLEDQPVHEFYIGNIVLGTILERCDDPRLFPTHVSVDDDRIGCGYSEGTDSLLNVFIRDVQSLSANGAMDFGSNNYEGRIAWSQVSYLNALLTILEDDPQYDFSLFDPIRPEIEARLDMEFRLLAEILANHPEQLKARRYSLDRSPMLFAVHTGRLLRLLKRYERIRGPSMISTQTIDAHQRNTEDLQDHAETLEFDTEMNAHHLAWPRGIALQYDGANLPYNQMNDWITGVIYGGQPSASIDLAKEILSILQQQENIPGRADFEWNYTWGVARSGWGIGDGISLNTPEYAGDLSKAHISYRTIDVNALLAIGSQEQSYLSDELLDFITSAVEQDGVYLSVNEELSAFGRKPVISRPHAMKYWRMDAPYQMQNSVWSIERLNAGG